MGEVKSERMSGGLVWGIEGVNGELFGEGVNGGTWGGEEWGSRGEDPNKGDGGQVEMGGARFVIGGKVGVGMQWGLEGLQWGETGVSGGNGGMEDLQRGGTGGQDAIGGAGRVTLRKMGG